MNLHSYAERMLPAIEAELQLAARSGEQAEYHELYDMIAYHMGWEGEGAGPEARGKRIRPLLVTLTSAACGGNWWTALPAAAAVELIHNFSLIHDDIEDNSPMRRGRPTVWSKWGIPQAINVGDAMFTLAHLEMLRLGKTAEPVVALQAAVLLQETCLKLTQGQFLDISYEKRFDLSLEAYWLMVSGKTAALLAACTGLGALTAGVRFESLEHYQDFGRNLGLAFQAQDDLLGIWGDAELTGKSSESDLVTGKKTLPVVFGLEQKKDFAQRWSAGPITPDEVPSLARLLETEGAREYTQQAADHFTQKAQESLAAARPLDEAGAALRELADMLLSREK